MKVAIVFHSIAGNTYLLAREYKKALKEINVEVDIFKVEDSIGETLTDIYLINAKDHKEEFKNIKTIKIGRELIDYDMIFMGSPTYYGNVSGQMKMFMDTFSDMWVDAPLTGKYFGSFTAAGIQRGGGELALQAMNVFAQHMGMIILSVSSKVCGDQPAYGILHISGHKSDVKLSEDIKQGIRDYIHGLKMIK